jgi:hypothetical protein
VKGQSFHQRKIKLPETAKLDYEELKARTTTALHKLGEQKFSEEPGGYSLENWMHGVKVLLDDFEEKMGHANLTSEYTERRRLLTEFVSKPVDVSLLDQEISEARQKIAGIEGRFDESRSTIRTRIDELKKEQATCSDELAREKKKLAEPPVEPKSGSIFKRLFRGNSNISVEESKVEVERLESRLKVIPDQILEQHRLMRSIEEHAPESPLAAEWKELEELRPRLAALEGERLERLDMVKERAELTASVAHAISEISPPKSA